MHILPVFFGVAYLIECVAQKNIVVSVAFLDKANRFIGGSDDMATLNNKTIIHFVIIAMIINTICRSLA